MVINEVLYERRFGVRNQFEVAVPFAMRESQPGQWSRGLGDVALAVKRAMFHSRRAGTIVSVAGEVVLPTGKESLGLGSGVTVFEPFVTFGQILPRNIFVHAQAGAELPADRDKAEARGVLARGGRHHLRAGTLRASVVADDRGAART